MDVVIPLWFVIFQSVSLDYSYDRSVSVWILEFQEPEILVKILKFQCGTRNSSVDLVISVLIVGLEHGSFVSKLNPRIPVVIST